MKRYLVRHGTGRLVELRKADRMIVKTIDGGQVSDMTFIGFDQGMTRNFNGWRRFGVPRLAGTLEDGDVLVDGDIKPVLRLVKSHSLLITTSFSRAAGENSTKMGAPGAETFFASSSESRERTSPTWRHGSWKSKTCGLYHPQPNPATMSSLKRCVMSSSA